MWNVIVPVIPLNFLRISEFPITFEVQTANKSC
jgi:hypothetical protein